jgi:hypothetical protein
MKPYKVIMMLCIALCCAVACKKQMDQSVSTQISAGIVSSASTLLPVFNPADFLFVHGIHNPFLAFTPGTDFYYINTVNDNGNLSYQHIHVVITSYTKKILGVNCTVVHDYLKEKGKITEDTYDWYAQDIFGNVWYFGENTRALTDTGWSTLGAWEAGKNNAVPGIAMFADPGAVIGVTYYQEFQQGVAEDQAKVVDTTSSAKVAYGSFKNCLKTKEFTRLDPTDIEHKFYVPGVGQVLTTSATEREELVSITHN